MQRQPLAVVAVAGPLLMSCAPVLAAPVMRDARDFYNPDLPSCGIQEAINSLPKEGGRVVLEARTYVLRASIVLKDDVTLSGQGRDTVLKRPAEVIHKLAQDATKGASSIVLEATDGLRVGDEVAIRDSKHNGWYATHGIIVRIEGNRVHIDDKLVQPYSVAQGAMALNHHPMVEVRRIWDYRWHTKRFVIEDITIDGNLKENPTPISDWSTAAVHLASAADGVVQRVVVRDFITDGISDQYGRFNVIRDCLVEGCRGNGFHPGTSVQGSRFANNTARNNEGDGFFFCADVTGIQVCNNTFVGNKKNGIGDLGGGGDSLNVVSGNICSGNGRHGIHAENGRGNSIIGNVCFDNSTSEPGKYAGVALENTTHTTLTGNICSCKLQKDRPATQGYGIVELGASDRNLITGNSACGNRSGGILTVGGKTVALGNVDMPPAGK